MLKHDQTLKINILSFEHETMPIECAFFKVQKPGLTAFSFSEFPAELLEQLKNEPDINTLYTDFQRSSNPDFLVEANLVNNPDFAIKYYTYQIRKYFKTKVDLVNPKHNRDIEIWVPEEARSNDLYKAYNLFGIRVQIAKMSSKPELLIYHNGTRKILKQSIIEYWDISHDVYTKVVYLNQFYNFEELPDEAKYKLQKVYPVMNKQVEAHFKITASINPQKNKHIELLHLLETFVSQYLNKDEFKNIIKLTSGQFIKVP